jgi:hypothetical protein
MSQLIIAMHNGTLPFRRSIMPSLYPAPNVTGVVNGTLHLDKYPKPEIIVDYPKIDKSHNVSVLWEIVGPWNRYVHWCGFAVRSPNESTLFTAKPAEIYGKAAADGNQIIVRYSILIEGEASPVFSEPLQFIAKATGPSAPGQRLLDLSVRETVRQWSGMNWRIFHQQVSSSSFEEYATVYVTDTSSEVALLWKDKDYNVLWQSEFQKPTPENPDAGISNMLEFKVPKSELMKCSKDFGYLYAIHLPSSGHSSSRPIRVCIDINCDPDR